VAQLHCIWGLPREAADCLGIMPCFLPLKIESAMIWSDAAKPEALDPTPLPVSPPVMAPLMPATMPAGMTLPVLL